MRASFILIICAILVEYQNATDPNESDTNQKSTAKEQKVYNFTLSLDENPPEPGIYIKKYAENVRDWFSDEIMDSYLKNIKQIYTDQIRKLLNKLARTPLKDLDSVNYIPNKMEKLTSAIVHIIKRMHKVLDEEHEYLKNQTAQIREAYNNAQFQLYVVAHDWNFYGLGRYFTREKMKELFQKGFF